MDTYTRTFRDLVTDRVTTRIATEVAAGSPQGGTDRSFESITANLIMADWETLARTLMVDQAVDRICGTERKRRGRPHLAGDKRRSK